MRPDGVHRVSQKDKLRAAAVGLRAALGRSGWAKEALRAALGRKGLEEEAGAAAFGGADGVLVSHVGAAKETPRLGSGRESVIFGGSR